MTAQQTAIDGRLTEPHKDPDALEELYETYDGDTAAIADHCDCSRSTVRRYLRGLGVTTGAPGPAYFQTREDGYEYWSIDQYSIYVHRLVAIAEYGIDAVAGGHVHHKNEVRWDNRPSNLMPTDGPAHHRREHTRPKPDEDQAVVGEWPGGGDRHDRAGQLVEDDQDDEQSSLFDFS